MAFEFKLPDIGEGVVEGEIVKWLVKPGDPIAVDQPMVEVMTDKATVVIPSPRAGVVVETRGKEGEIAKVHSVLVVIDEAGGAAAAGPSPQREAPARAAGSGAQPAPARAGAPAGAPRAAAAPARGGAPAQAAPRGAATRGAAESAERGATARGAQDDRGAAARSGAARRSEPEAPHGAPRAGAGANAGSSAAPANGHSEPRRDGKVLAAPATRRLARELGIDLATVNGTGPAGRVTSDDVRRAAEAPEPTAYEAQLEPQHAEQEAPQAPARPAVRAPAPAPSAGDERIAVRGLRKRIWDNMTLSSFTAAHFTFVEECDVTDLVKTRERFNTRLREGEEKLTYLPFIVKAVIAALRRFPDLNAHVDDDNMEYIRRADYHIGIATASERGLIVPVVRHADRRSILDLAHEIRRLGEAVRTGKVQQQDLGGSTFTITSLGKDGGIFATPIINYPEVAIMGVHKISKKPVVKDDQIAIREMMNLSLSFDHRLIDGHVGAAFTYAVINLLQDPERLMMEMA